MGVGGESSAHPDFLEERLNRRQLLEWIAFDRIRPIGRRDADIRSAVQTFWIRAGLVESSDDSPNDYLPQFDDGPKTKSAAQLIVDEIRELMQ